MPAKWNRRKDPCRVGVIGHDLTHLPMPQQVFICPVFAAGNRSRPNRIDSSLPFLPRLNPLSSTAQGSSLEALPPDSVETPQGCGGPHQVTKDKQARYTGDTPEIHRRFTGDIPEIYRNNPLPTPSQRASNPRASPSPLAHNAPTLLSLIRARSITSPNLLALASGHR